MENQILIALKNNKLLKNILFDDLRFDGIRGKLLTVHEGEILFRESEKTENIYLVVSGEINLLKKRASYKALSFIYSDHDFFGCEEFVEKTNRKSTAVALRDSYIIAFNRNEVELLIEQNEDILSNIYASISDREPDSIETHIPEDSVEPVSFTSKSNEVEQNGIVESDQSESENESIEDSDTIPIPDEETSDAETENMTEENIPALEQKLNETEESFSLDDLESLNEFTTIEQDEEKKETELALNENDILMNLPDDDIPSPEGEIDFSDFESSETDTTKFSEDKNDEDLLSQSTDLDFNFNERFGVVKSLDETEGTTEESASDFSFDEKESFKLPETSAEDDFDLSKLDSELSDLMDNEISFPDEDENKIESPEISDEPELDDATEQSNSFGLEEKEISDGENSFDTVEEETRSFNDKTESEMTTEENNSKSTVHTLNDFPTAALLEKINKAAELVNSNIKIDDVLQNIVNVACDLTHADRGTLYIVDTKKNELWSKIAMGSESREIKLKIGEGIAGYVAQSGETMNIEKAHDDPRFNTSFDRASGYETKSMITFPIKNKNHEVVGVLQLLNSRHGKFSELDEEFLKALSTHAAMALQNADLVEKLLSSERVSSLGKMANFLIQDIKKPIMVSKRYAEHLKSKELPEEAEKVLDMLLDQLNHVADLVQATSSYSEGEIVLRSVVKNINEILDDAAGRSDSFVRSRNCKFVKEFDKNVNVKISEKQFYQAFHHIVKNACDAMPEGGDIVLNTKRRDKFVDISISDSGLGIPESLHEKIFEPFMAHGKKDTTGLGLSITKKIIEEHGGTIKVESETGEGAKFIISFPIVQSAV